MCEYQFSLFYGKYLKMKWLGHVIRAVTTLYETAKLFLEWPYHSALLLEMIESSNCLISLPAPGIVSFNFLFHFIIDI